MSGRRSLTLIASRAAAANAEAMDVAATCSASESEAPAQTLAVALSVLFSLYVFVDSLLAALVIARKCQSQGQSQGT